jgi:hypothetical protein
METLFDAVEMWCFLYDMDLGNDSRSVAGDRLGLIGVNVKTRFGQFEQCAACGLHWWYGAFKFFFG